MLNLSELTQQRFLIPIPRTKPCGSDKSRYLSFKRRVKQRDNYTCRHCGSKHNLTVHHIKKVSEYPLGTYILSNCLSLCWKCHCSLHNKEGKS